MTRLKIVVSDSSVLMDLAKVGLIEAALALPFDFMIPDVMIAAVPTGHRDGQDAAELRGGEGHWLAFRAFLSSHAAPMA